MGCFLVHMHHSREDIFFSHTLRYEVQSHSKVCKHSHSVRFHAFPKRRFHCLCCAWIKQWAGSYHRLLSVAAGIPLTAAVKFSRCIWADLPPYLTARADSRFWTLCSDFFKKKSTCIYPFFSRIVASACHQTNPYSVVYVL